MDGHRHSAIRDAAEALAKIEDYVGAFEFAALFNETYAFPDPYRLILDAQASAGKWDEIKKTLDHTPVRLKPETIARAAYHWGKNGKVKDAERQVEQAQGKDRELILSRLVEGCAERKDFDRARHFLADIKEDRYQRARALEAIAMAEIEAGLWKGAQDTALTLDDGNVYRELGFTRAKQAKSLAVVEWVQGVSNSKAKVYQMIGVASGLLEK